MKSFVALLLIFSWLHSFSQTEWYHFPEEFYFVKEVPAKEWHGKNFRYEIAVKADPADTFSKVRIHGIAVGKGHDDFINSDFVIESRAEQDWIIYTIIGKVDKDAMKLWFYAAVNGNGNFYFDDISFYVEDLPAHWKQLRLYNYSFEENNPDIFTGYYVSKRKSPTLKTQLSKQIFKTGKQSLWIISKGLEPAKAIVVNH